MEYNSTILGTSAENEGLRISVFVPYVYVNKDVKEKDLSEDEIKKALQYADSVNNFISRIHTGGCKLIQAIDSSEVVKEDKKE